MLGYSALAVEEGNYAQSLLTLSEYMPAGHTVVGLKVSFEDVTGAYCQGVKVFCSCGGVLTLDAGQIQQLEPDADAMTFVLTAIFRYTCEDVLRESVSLH